MNWIFYSYLIVCITLCFTQDGVGRNNLKKNEKKEIISGSLCDMYSNMPIQLTIGTGAGQPVSMSSQFSSNLNGLNVEILGDFAIDSDFSFLNCKFKIGNNSRIIVVGSKKLTIDNSNFFVVVLYGQVLS